MATKETAVLDLDVSGFKGGIRDAIAEVGKLDRAMKDTNKNNTKGFTDLVGVVSDAPGPLGQMATSFKALNTAMLANPILAVVAGVVALTAGLGKLAHGTAEANDQMIDLADATGMAATELSSYRTLAEKVLPSENIEKLAEGFSKLSVQQRAAFDGNEDLQTAFEYFGVTSSNSAEMLSQLADGFNRTAGDVDRTAFLVKIFGDGLAKELAPALALGSEGIQNLRKENDELGRTLTDESIKATQEYQENIKELGQRFNSLADSIGNSVIPIINDLFAAFDPKPVEEQETAFEGLGIVLGDGTQDAVGFSAGLAAMAGELEVTTERTEANTKATKGAKEAADEYLKVLWATLYAQIAADKEWERFGTIISKNIGMTEEQWEANSQLSDGIEGTLIPPLVIAKEAMEGVGDATEATSEKITWMSLLVGGIDWDELTAGMKEAIRQADFFRDQTAALAEGIEGLANAQIDKQVAAAQAVEDAALKELRTRKDVTEAEIALAEKASKAKMDSLKSGLEAGSKAMKVAFLLQQGAALASIGISTAEAIVKGIAIFGPPPSPAGIAAIAAASVVGGVAAASVLAQTIGHFKPTGVSLSGGGGGSGGKGGSSAPSQGASQPGTNGSAPGPGAGLNKPSSGVDDTFTDTPGIQRVGGRGAVFGFAPGDMVIAAKSHEGLQRQVNVNVNQDQVVIEQRMTRMAIERQNQLLELVVANTKPKNQFSLDPIKSF